MKPQAIPLCQWKDFFHLASNGIWINTLKQYEGKINTNNTDANDDEEDEKCTQHHIR
jgi:hypothetical protein